MKIQLTNKTAYRDDDIRAIVHGACRAAGVSLKLLRLTVTTAKRGSASGYAYYPRLRQRSLTTVNTMRLCIPPPSFSVGATGGIRGLAQVALHEAMHLNGASHGDMTEEQYNCTMPVPWADSLPLRAKEAPDPELRKAAARADRLEHAQAMLAKAETRQKRAATILKKWKRRVGALSR